MTAQNMKIAFINPIKISKDNKLSCPPLSLLILASYIRKKLPQLQIKVFDALIEQKLEEDLIKFFPDVVAITSTTSSILDAYELCLWCKRNMNCKIILGGCHVSVLPHEAMKYADYVVIGDGESALYEIINNLLLNKPSKEGIIDITYKIDGDEYTIPAYDLIDMEKYILSKDNIVRSVGYAKPDSRGTTMITSRGCPYKCIFCHNSWRKCLLSYISSKDVVKEIEYLIKNYNINAFYFFDDEFLCNKDRLFSIFRLLSEKNIKIVWAGSSRADTIIKYGISNLKKIKEYGCSLICIGCESGNNRVLQLLKANSTTVEQNKEAIRLLNIAGIKVSISMMIGTPSETYEEMKDSLDFIRNSDIVAGSVCITTPYPGTVLYKMCEDKGLLKVPLNYNKFKHNVLPEDSYIVCDTMSEEEFISFFKYFSVAIANKTLPNRIIDGGLSFKDIFMAGIKKYPFQILSYPFLHPTIFFDLIRKKAFLMLKDLGKKGYYKEKRRMEPHNKKESGCVFCGKEDSAIGFKDK